MSELTSATRFYHSPDKLWSAFDSGSPNTVAVIDHVAGTWYATDRLTCGLDWQASKTIGAEPIVSPGGCWQELCDRLAIFGPSNRSLKAHLAGVLAGVARRPLLTEGLAGVLAGELVIPASQFPKHGDPVGALTQLCEEQHGLNVWGVRRNCTESSFRCLMDLAALGYPVLAGGEFPSFRHSPHSVALLSGVVRTGNSHIESLAAERAFVKQKAPFLLGELFAIAAKTGKLGVAA